MAASAPPPPPLFNQPGLLPSMAAAPPRKLYRVRPEDEVEDVVWRRQEGDAADADSSSSAAEVDAEEGTLATATPARLRSVRSKVPASIRFVNKSARAVRALWVDFDGNEVRVMAVLLALLLLHGGSCVACMAPVPPTCSSTVPCSPSKLLFT